MRIEEFKEVIIKECQKNGIVIEEFDIAIFYEYMINILEWNKKINLTSIKDEKEFITKHIIDSLTVNKYIRDGNRVIDIGTGAGFPGVPIKISKKECRVTLIDSINKKLNVIKTISEQLNLKYLDIIHARAEKLSHEEQYREKFDVATTRAVSNMATITEYMLPFLKIGGIAVCMKGPNFEEELEKSKKAIKLLGGELNEVERVWINGEFERNIIIINKIKNTPGEYPRKQGVPQKEPIL